MKYSYPAVIEKNGKIYKVSFPDLGVTGDGYESLHDTESFASDFLSEVLLQLKDYDKAINKASAMDDTPCPEGAKKLLVKADTSEYLKRASREPGFIANMSSEERAATFAENKDNKKESSGATPPAEHRSEKREEEPATLTRGLVSLVAAVFMILMLVGGSSNTSFYDYDDWYGSDWEEEYDSEDFGDTAEEFKESLDSAYQELANGDYTAATDSLSGYIDDAMDYWDEEELDDYSELVYPNYESDLSPEAYLEAKNVYAYARAMEARESGESIELQHGYISCCHFDEKSEYYEKYVKLRGDIESEYGITGNAEAEEGTDNAE